ncbi:MAG: murein hydrolase activator EnvC family protein [Candidatus Dormibacteria bacterium]
MTRLDRIRRGFLGRLAPVPAALAVALPLVLGGGVPAHADALTQAQGQYDTLQAQVDSLDRQITDTENQAALIQQKIDAIQGQINIKQAELNQEQARLTQLQKQLDETATNLAHLEVQVQQRTTLFDDRMRSLYKQGEVHYLDLLFTSNNFQEMVERVFDMQQIVAADQLLLNQLKRDREQVAVLKQQLQDQRDQQAQVVSAIAADKRVLDGKRDELGVARFQLGQQDASLKALRAQAEAALAQVRKEIDDLEAAAGQVHGTGTYLWPEHGEITQGFGCTSYAGEPYDSSCPPSAHYFHSGIDIAADWGTPIHASDTGMAYQRGCSSCYGYGLYVIIIHGNGMATLYGHMSAVTVGPSGTAVNRGDIIGAEGSTGNSTGPHLHFEIRVNNVPQNPLGYLS